MLLARVGGAGLECGGWCVLLELDHSSALWVSIYSVGASGGQLCMGRRRRRAPAWRQCDDWIIPPLACPLSFPRQNPQSHTNLEGWPARHKLDPVSVHDLSWVSEKVCSHPVGSQPTGTTG